MPTTDDYKKARRLPAKPAGPNRACDGAVQHDCDRHGPDVHPWDNQWAPPDPERRVRPGKKLLTPGEYAERRCERRRRVSAKITEPADRLSLQPPDPPELPALDAPAVSTYRLPPPPHIVPPEHQNGKCPCKPWVVTKRGRQVSYKKYYHRVDVCPHGKPGWTLYKKMRDEFRSIYPGARQKYHPNPSPFRDPALPPPLKCHQYEILLSLKVRLVLCTYDPITLKKRPIYDNWLVRQPTLAEIIQHHANDPNALVAVIPYSVGAVLTDVDQGDWHKLADLLGSDITNATRRRQGRHIWTLAPLEGPLPSDTGFEIPEDGIKGDTRCRRGYAVIWNYKAVQNIVRIKVLHDARLEQQAEQSQGKTGNRLTNFPVYPLDEMRKYRSVSVSAGQRPEDSDLTDEEPHYEAIYEAQDSAAQRQWERHARIFEAKRLHRRGMSIKRIARYQGMSLSVAYEYVNGPVPQDRLLFTNELRERAERNEGVTRKRGMRELLGAEQEQLSRRNERVTRWGLLWTLPLHLVLGCVLAALWAGCAGGAGSAGSGKVVLPPPTTTTPPTLPGLPAGKPTKRTKHPPRCWRYSGQLGLDIAGIST